MTRTRAAGRSEAARRARTPLLAACALIALGGAAGPAAARTPHKPFWLAKVTITEYFPVPEEWFVGRRVSAPGLRDGGHRIDWLYSARGVAMEGDGIGLDGRRYHIESTGSGGWVNAAGKATRPGRSGWSRGGPFWRAGGMWRNGHGFVTFPLSDGGWSRGAGKHHLAPPHGISFAPGPSRPLTYWRSIAVDPRTIPLGSRVYIPAYKSHGGWFRAVDTGGAIIGRHVDVYRPPPLAADGGDYRTGQRIYVIPPK
jgi:hypothetical protein